MKKLFLIIAVILLASCSKEKLKIDDIIEIKMGKAVYNPRYGLLLGVVNVDDDSCPIGAVCFWEGNAAVQLHLKTTKSKYDFTLDTQLAPPFKNDTIIEGIKYQLIDVLPYPVDGEMQQEKTITIFISNQ